MRTGIKGTCNISFSADSSSIRAIPAPGGEDEPFKQEIWNASVSCNRKGVVGAAM